MARAQLERIAGVGDALVGFANDHAIDAHAARQNPLLGAVPRCVGMLPQQPIQQGAGVRFVHSSDRPASASSYSVFDHARLKHFPVAALRLVRQPL